MSGSERPKTFCTFRKDEAAFYLNELAKGLLKNRVTVPVNDCASLMTDFAAFRLEMKVGERQDRWQVDIRMSWSKPVPGLTLETGGHHREGEMGKAMVYKGR